MTSDSLVKVQRQAGAVFAVDQTGRESPQHFGNARAEYEAAVGGTALFDLSSRGHIELTGRDRLKLLHNFCTNDVRSLTPGKGCEAFLTTVQGKVLAHVLVFCGEDSLWLDTTGGTEERIAEHLNKYIITEDVEVHIRTPEFGELFGVVATAGGLTPTEATMLGVPAGSVMERCDHFTREVGGSPFSMRRFDFWNTPGFLICAPYERLASFWSMAMELGVKPAGWQAFHARRIEAVFPWYGLDASDANLAQEVGRTAEAISFTKGCYLGQEPIARIYAMGHVNQELRGIRLEAGPLPPPGSVIVVPGDIREAGRVTSSVISPQSGLPVALAYLKRNYTTSGTRLNVRVEGAEVPGTVFEAPSDAEA
jgi:folate-binding protein YgfZ